MFYVPVVNQKQEPLMPTTLLRAKRWIVSGKATPFYKKGIFCVRLNVNPSDNKKQDIAVGIDPGSKREAYTVKSKAHTYLNILSDAVTWVKDAVEQRAQMRKTRRNRKTPYRKPRFNRAKGGLSPSTKARWQLKLRICNWLVQMFPISSVVVEDIKAKTKGKRRWDASFSPLEVGKKWFYENLSLLAPVITRSGWETKKLRDKLKLNKTGCKTCSRFDAHNVDSWVLAWDVIGGAEYPENKQFIRLVPMQFHRRQLHALQFSSGGVRRNYGSTRSLGFKRGSLVRHKKYGLSYVGGTMKEKISLHNLQDGKRLTQSAKVIDCKFLTYLSWRM